MTIAYKVLGQLKPAVTTESILYTVPSSTQSVCSTLSVCNTSTTSGTFRVRIKVNNAADDDKQYLMYDAPISAKDTLLLSFGATLNDADVIKVYSSNGSIVFQLFGSEIT